MPILEAFMPRNDNFTVRFPREANSLKFLIPDLILIKKYVIMKVEAFLKGERLQEKRIIGGTPL